MTIDPAFVRAGNEAVARRRASSFSAWVNAALAEQVAKEHRLVAMAEAIAMYESEFGKITDEDVEAQIREDRRNAIRVGGKRSSGKRRRRAA